MLTEEDGILDVGLVESLTPKVLDVGSYTLLCLSLFLKLDGICGKLFPKNVLGAPLD